MPAMTIRARLRTLILFTLAVAVTVAAVVLAENHRMNEDRTRAENFQAVLETLFQLKSRTFEYLMSPEARVAAQWQAGHDEIGERLRTIIPASPEENAIAESLRQDHERSKAIFDQLAALSPAAGRKGEPEAASREILAGQLQLKIQSIASRGLELETSARHQIAATQKRATLMITALMTMLVVAIAGGVLLLGRSILGPLDALRKGTEIVGAGDLEYRAGLTIRDEIGDLSRAFERMTENLKRTKAEVMQASAYTRSLIEASLDPLVTISADGKIMDVNKATEDVTGLSREQLIGSDFSSYFTEPDKARQGYQQVLAKGLVRDYPVSIRHASGTVIDVLYNAAVFKNEADEVQGVFAAARDITERKRLELKVKERTGQLEKVLQEAQEAVGVLTSSSSEILTAIAQLASGAMEAATAVSETTTTVEEVRQTAQLSSQKAKDIADAGQNAAQMLQGGQRNVESAVSEMNRIRDQMSSIAETIVTLSEQSQAIGEITGTVNELAEQSNLLAVNAAIEAAKAGEQGKGFAVVAQEIKSLAAQSKQATSQVRSLLADIQKAISNAVMATEQTGKVVESGVAQSSKARESIRDAVNATVSVARTSSQIAASSQQQLIGVDQVATAMENINQASSQNALTTKQVESIAQSLHELSQKLKTLVEQDRG
jgi:PAS domain S-box-containing protein